MSPETRDFLASVRRAEDPSPSDESRVLTALEASVAASLIGSDTSATPGAASGTSSLLKAVGALLGVSVGAALLATAVSPAPTEPSVSPPAHRASVSTEVTRPSPPPVPSAAPSTTASVAVSPSVAPLSKPVAPAPTASSAASLRAEIALLARVHSALERGDGTEALQELDQHATGDRQFVAERRAARIAGLCLLGRVSEAQALAAIFFRENSQSVQRTAVERSCAGTKTTPER